MSNQTPTPVDAHHSTPFAGVSLLRDHLLPTLLKEDHAAILYWAGKELARHNPLSTYEETFAYFNRVQFGTLSLVKETRNKTIFLLSGDVITERMHEKDPCFTLEAGFLAQQLQNQKQLFCEATLHPEPRNHHVLIHILFDKKETLDLPLP